MHGCLCMHHDIRVTAGQLVEVFCMGITLGHSLPYCDERLQGCMSVPVQVHTNGVRAVDHESVAVFSTACAWRGCCTDSLQAETALPVSLLPLPPLHMLGCQVWDRMTSPGAHQSAQGSHLQAPCFDALHRNCGEPGSRTVLKVRLSSICHLSCARELRAPSLYATSAKQEGICLNQWKFCSSLATAF